LQVLANGGNIYRLREVKLVSYSFYDLNGDKVIIADSTVETGEDLDVETKKVTGYYVLINDRRYDIKKSTHDSIKTEFSL